MTSQNSNKIKQLHHILIVETILLLVAGILLTKYWFADSSETVGLADSFIVKRGNLTISATISGEVETRYTTDVKCQVEGAGTTILYLIDEGTILTEDDVKNGTVLIELDSSQLKEQVIQKDMSFNTAKAGYEEALRNHEIQVEQNISDITASQLSEEFALMDFKKYLGTDLSEKILNQDNGQQYLVIPDVDVSVLENFGDESKSEARQSLLELQNAIENAQESLQRADSKFLGTQKLFEKSYVTKMELDADQAALNQAGRNLESRKTALELFLEYDFNKQAKQLYSNYREANRQTKRTRAMALAKIAQAEAQRDSAQVTLLREEENLIRIKNSLDACIIKAPVPGMVVYEDASFFGVVYSRIELGGQLRYRQKIFSIPSTNEMVVQAKIHESWIDRIEPNQVSLITLDAYPDQTFTGATYHVALLPSNEDRAFSSSDLKVYDCAISIDGAHSQIRDGMSAKAEIIVDQLENVLTIPVQAVAFANGQKVCYVIDEKGALSTHPVEVGSFNNNFIEIKSGLVEGEKISLVPIRQNQTMEQVEQQKQNIIEKALQNKNNASSSTPR